MGAIEKVAKGAASVVSGVAKGIKNVFVPTKPKIKYNLPDPPNIDDLDQQRLEEERLKAQRRVGRQQTLLTRPASLTDESGVVRPTLLGR